MFKGACRLDDPTHRSINSLSFQVKNFLAVDALFSRWFSKIRQKPLENPGAAADVEFPKHGRQRSSSFESPIGPPVV